MGYIGINVVNVEMFTDTLKKNDLATLVIVWVTLKVVCFYK